MHTSHRTPAHTVPTRSPRTLWHPMPPVIDWRRPTCVARGCLGPLNAEAKPPTPPFLFSSQHHRCSVLQTAVSPPPELPLSSARGHHRVEPCLKLLEVPLGVLETSSIEPPLPPWELPRGSPPLAIVRPRINQLKFASLPCPSTIHKSTPGNPCPAYHRSSSLVDPRHHGQHHWWAPILPPNHFTVPPWSPSHRSPTGLVASKPGLARCHRPAPSAKVPLFLIWASRFWPTCTVPVFN
jgi:hypothetical protein